MGRQCWVSQQSASQMLQQNWLAASFLQALIWVLTGVATICKLAQSVSSSKITNICCYLFLFLFLFPFPSQIPVAIISLGPISCHWSTACWLVYSGWDDWGKDWGLSRNVISEWAWLHCGKAWICDFFFPNAIITTRLAGNLWTKIPRMSTCLSVQQRDSVPKWMWNTLQGHFQPRLIQLTSTLTGWGFN